MSPASASSQFEQLLRENLGRLRAVSRAYTRDDADDLLQEILLQLWRSMPQFRGKSSFETWAYRVAINTSLQWQRTAARRGKHLSTQDEGQHSAKSPGTSPIEFVSNDAATADPAKALRQFLETLGGRDKAILLMFLDDFDHSQIAEVIGIAKGSVRVRLHRLEKKLLKWSEGQV